MRSSNIGYDLIFTAPSEKILMVLKFQEVLQKMHPEDINVFANEITEKYANHPDNLENECYIDFVTGYINADTKDIIEDDDIENYATPVSNPNEEKRSEGKIIVLKNRLG